MIQRKKYSNMDGVSTKKTFKDMQQWQRERRAQQRDLSYIVPQCPDKQLPWLQSNRQHISVTWIGHATFLIQCAGLNIVTDPVWARRMGFAKRLSEPGLPIDALPPIDVVLLSHAHYDHLHTGSLRRLPGQPKLLVPVGLKSMLQRKGFSNVTELAWWESTTIGQLRFDFVPAQHWTRRSLFDMNTSHWGGWIIHSPADDHNIYFAGDSGYFRGFQNIGEVYTIDTALMPIGAYDPVWFMKESHMTPEEAVTAYLDIGAKHFIPMHYGAFRLADDTAIEALQRLQQHWNQLQLPPNLLQILKLGETFRPAIHLLT